jgi:hypothetical protein
VAVGSPSPFGGNLLVVARVRGLLVPGGSKDLARLPFSPATVVAGVAGVVTGSVAAR